jgi:Uma2 family endonuclease
MASLPKARYTPDQYLEMERKSELKNEYIDGEIVAMVGASERHNLIAGNLMGELHRQLKGTPCRVYPGDMRVDLRERHLYAYPDVVVVCDEPILRDGEMDNLLNPTVIIEVLSKSTEAFDRGRKSMKYRRIESLREYLLVSQEEPHTERYVRLADEWRLREYDGLDKEIELLSVNCRLRLSDIYDKVRFNERAD